MASIKIHVTRDEAGNPTLLTVNKNGRISQIQILNDEIRLIGDVSTLLDVFEFGALTPHESFVIPEPLTVKDIGTGPILFDDFEFSGDLALLKWSAGALDNSNAFNGGRCLKVTIGGAATVSTSRAIPLKNSRLLTELYFASDDWTAFAGVDTFQVTLFLDDGVQARQAQLQFDRTANKWYIYGDSTYTFNQVKPFSPLAGVSGAWHRLAFEVDFLNNKWLNVEIDSHKINFGNFALTTGTTTNTLTGSLTLRGHAGAGGALLYFDDVLIREVN